jgi:choline monooxygenase
MSTPRFPVDPDISRAHTISTEVYNNPAIYAEALEKMFATSWQYIGDTGRVGESGSVYPFTLLNGSLNEPLVLTRDKESALHCLSNVCTHRGNLVAWEPCQSSQLRCRYHGRVFDLAGQFQFMPEFREVVGFPCADDNLKRLPLFSWGKLLFTSLHPGMDPDAVFGDMMRRVSWLPMDQLRHRPDLSSVWNVDASWALYCENYLEGFHIPFVHGGLSTVLDYGNYTTELFRYSNLQLGIGKKDDVCFDLPPESPDYGKQVAGYYFWVFPNMMFNFYPWGLSFNLVEPTGVNTCRVTFVVYTYDERKLGAGAGSGLDQVELEDEEVVNNVQKGVRSRFYRHGRYSVIREQGTHHFHRLLSEFLG